MFLKFLIITLLIVVLALYLNRKEKLNKIKESTTDISEVLDTMNLPVVSFSIGNKKLNFLLDTGSDRCIINTKYLKKLPHKKTEYKTVAYGVDGKEFVVNINTVNLKYKDYVFDNVSIYDSDLSAPFNNIKKQHNITIHGLIGNDFLRSMGFVIDYSKNIIYLN